jgi:hypothetical protein
MLDLRKVIIEDREWVTALMRRTGLRGSEYTFANLFNWSQAHTLRIGRFEDLLIARSGVVAWTYLYPAGEGDLIAAVEAMKLQAQEASMPFSMYGIPAEGVNRLEGLFPGRFSFKPLRDNFDYIYLRENLAALSGKKLHAKRNHINRFRQDNPDWRYERLTLENLPEAMRMSVEWCRRNGCHETHSLQREACAVRSAFEHYGQLGLTGGLLRAKGVVVAFTFGSPITDDTFGVHVEKAFSEVQGAYPMINQQFVLNELSGYTYVNREEDTGDEGLRRSKQSYQPIMMYERYSAVEKL